MNRKQEAERANWEWQMRNLKACPVAHSFDIFIPHFSQGSEDVADEEAERMEEMEGQGGGTLCCRQDLAITLRSCILLSQQEFLGR